MKNNNKNCIINNMTNWKNKLFFFINFMTFYNISLESIEQIKNFNINYEGIPTDLKDIITTKYPELSIAQINNLCSLIIITEHFLKNSEEFKKIEKVYEENKKDNFYYNYNLLIYLIIF